MLYKTIILEKLEEYIYLYSTSKYIGTTTNGYYQKIKIDDFFKNTQSYIEKSLNDCDKNILNNNPSKEIFNELNFKTINSMYNKIVTIYIDISDSVVEITPSKNMKKGNFRPMSDKSIVINKNIYKIDNLDIKIKEIFNRSL